VGDNRRKTLMLWDTTEENLSNILRLFLVISHNEGNPLLLYSIPQRRKNFSIVSHNGGKPLLLYPTTDENLLRCIPQLQKKLILNYYTRISKFIFTHESGSQVEQLVEKNWR
jgi:hypothetical protein